MTNKFLRSIFQFRFLLLALCLTALILGAADLAGGLPQAAAQEENAPAVSEPAPSADVSEPESSPAVSEPEPSYKPESLFYMNPLLLIYFAFCVAAWLYGTAWVCDDAVGVGAKPRQWTSFMFVAGGAGLVITVATHAAVALAIPAFAGAVFVFYVKYRNGVVPQLHKLFVPGQRQGLAQAVVGGGEEEGAAPSVGLNLARADGAGLGSLIAKRPELAEAGERATELLIKAVVARCISVSLLPAGGQMAARFNLDGVAHDLYSFESELGSQICSCFSWLGQLDRGKRTGSFETDLPGEEKLEIRLNPIKTRLGAGLMLTLPDWSKDLYKQGCEALGMHEAIVSRLTQVLKEPKGALLISGPPGSGLTTTLYGITLTIDIFTRDVAVVEEKSEGEFENIPQFEMGEQAFAEVYAEVMREEPDTIVFGELKDPTTANQILRFAVESGLVITAARAHDSVETLRRLVGLGVEPEVLSDSVMCVLNQRLVRKLCERCKEPIEPSQELLTQLRIDPESPGRWFKAVGCQHCLNTGYNGRTGVFEMLVVSQQLKDLLKSGRASAAEMRQAAGRKGLRTLRQDGITKVREGITTLEELNRCLK